MGCMVINTYLLANPDLKIDGVVFESPFFKMGKSMNMDPVREFLSRLVRPLLKNFVINVPFKMQEMSRNAPWVRSMVQSRKIISLINTNGLVCFIDACKLIQEEA